MNSSADFAAHCLGLLKSRGPSGPTGPTPEKSLSLNDKVGTTQPHEVGPVNFEWSQDATVSGTNKEQYKQSVTEAVTSGTSGTTTFNDPAVNGRSAVGPSDCYAFVDHLRERESPDWISDHRWSEIISDTEIFLSRWGDAAQSLGWTKLDLLGVHPTAPAARVGMMGLLLFVHGGAVVALTAGSATIRRPSQAILIYRRHDTTGAVLISEATS